MEPPRIAIALLVEPRADPGPALTALRAAGAGEIGTVVLPAPGARAAARNAALELAGAADVLALVDHDVRVAPGWGEALRAAWSDPGAERVAVVGGALRPACVPPWLDAAAHAGVLGLVEPGTDAPRFDGGNVAFRTAALRGVGGFFPVGGHPDAHDTLGDDRRAQHELAAVGWTARTVAGLAARRDLSALTPGILVRRRLRTGARTTALRQATRTGAGVLVARATVAGLARAARGDGRGTLDRGAWAAGGAGGLLGSVLAHRELQPDRASTALRPAVPAPAPGPVAARLHRMRPARRRIFGAVLLYHRVADIEDDPLGLAVAPRHFAEQLAVLAQRWTPTGLEDLLGGTAGPRAVALTFDDGYHDNLLHALPALEAAAIPATLFASTGHIATGEGFWWDEVTRLLATTAPAGDGILTLDLPDGTRAWAPADGSQRASVARLVRGTLQTRDRATIAAALAAVRRWAGSTVAAAPPPERDRPLTVAELRRLAAAGPFTVQAHGRTHLSLAHAPADRRADELAGAAADLAAWLGAAPTIFSFPFGVPEVDVDAATRAAAGAAGYRWATINAPGLVREGGDRLALPRLAVPDVGGPAFARWLDGVFPGR